MHAANPGGPVNHNDFHNNWIPCDWLQGKADSKIPTKYANHGHLNKRKHIIGLEGGNLPQEKYLREYTVICKMSNAQNCLLSPHDMSRFGQKYVNMIKIIFKMEIHVSHLCVKMYEYITVSCTDDVNGPIYQFGW